MSATLQAVHCQFHIQSVRASYKKYKRHNKQIKYGIPTAFPQLIWKRVVSHLSHSGIIRSACALANEQTDQWAEGHVPDYSHIS
jgi:hypothetical protein